MDGVAQMEHVGGGDEIALTLDEFTERYLRPAVRAMLDAEVTVPEWLIRELNEEKSGR